MNFSRLLPDNPAEFACGPSERVVTIEFLITERRLDGKTRHLISDWVGVVTVGSGWR